MASPQLSLDLFFSVVTFWFGGCWDQFIPAKRILGVKVMMRYVQFFTWFDHHRTNQYDHCCVLYVYLGLRPLTLLIPNISCYFFLFDQIPQPWSMMASLTGTLQHYNKTTVYGFIQSVVFIQGVRYLVIYLSHLYGNTHPEVGVILAMAIGKSLGDLHTHLFANFFSIFYYRKVLAAEGIHLRDFFGHEYTSPEIKIMLIYGIKRNAPRLINQVPSYSSFLVNLTVLPQMASLTYLSGTANSVASYVNQYPSIGANVISEAFMNGKKKLTQYYIRQTLHYSLFFPVFTCSFNVDSTEILTQAIIDMGITSYAIISSFMIPCIINNIPTPYSNITGAVLSGSNHPLFQSITGIISSWLGLFFTLLWMVWLQLPQKYGLTAIFWILPCGQLGTTVIMLLINFIFIHKKVVPIKIAWWPNVGVSLVSGGIFFLYDWLAANFIFYPLIALVGFYPALLHYLDYSN